MRRLLGQVLCVAIVIVVWPTFARPQSTDDKLANEAKAAGAESRFELQDGDRVVFLGNAFFEREGRYGYIETMLTTRYPGKRITFRNLGWSGDTVWGESRGYFEPEKGYQNLIDLVAELKPTVIFLAYGNNEAFAGKEGLEPFVKQYNKLLDDLEKVTKRIVIVGPLQVMWFSSLPEPLEQNKSIKLYRLEIQVIAKQRRHPFIDLYSKCWTGNSQLDHTQRISYDGIHGTELGYHLAAGLISCQGKSLNRQPDERLLSIPTDPQGESVIDGSKVSVVIDAQSIRIDLLDEALPLPPAPTADEEPAQSPRLIPIYESPYVPRGFRTIRLLPHLSPGNYVLKIDGHERPPVGSGDLSSGVRVESPPEFEQLEKLRQTIIAKNQLFFYRWRPQNTTYLLGFRKHEQGQNATEIAQFDPLIEAKEKEIFKLAQPVPHKYELIRVKDDETKKPESEKGAAK